MKVIGISGKAGSGKDTVAQMLVDHGFLVVALADEMKRFCAKVFGFSHEQLWGPSHLRNATDPRWRLSPRGALQTLGDWGRAQNADIWVNRVLAIVAALDGDPRLGYSQAEGLGPVQAHTTFKRPEPSGGIVVPDTRFANEISLIKHLGGVVARVERPGAGLPGEAGKHPSETEQDAIPDAAFDVVLANNGTIADLQQRVMSAFHLVAA